MSSFKWNENNQKGFGGGGLDIVARIYKRLFSNVLKVSDSKWQSLLGN